MQDSHSLSTLEPLNRPSVADSVFDELHRQILSAELRPGTRMSEMDVAQALGVSRQPVRDAFYRLSKLGFLLIRPQRATMVSAISEQAVMRASFIRTAIETETVRVACACLSKTDHDALSLVIERQRHAVETGDASAFHALDDQFHREICERAGHGFAWEVIRENKAHMDRVRFLSLSFALTEAFVDHETILDAIRRRDVEEATQQIRLHLSRISGLIVKIRADHQPYFANEPVTLAS